MRDSFTIIDGHVHTFSTDEIASRIIKAFNKIYSIGFENPGTGTIENVLANMNKCGVDFTVMANFSPAKILHDNNLWGLEISKENSRFVPLVSFHPDMEGSLSSYLDSYVQQGAKGIKIHPMAQGFDPNHHAMRDVYEYSSKISLPVVFHCGRVSNARLNHYADIDALVPIIENYPELPVVLTHMADGNADDVLTLSKRYDNVYFDTSIVITGYPSLRQVNEPSWLDDSMVADVINEIGAEKVIFGSDYPWGSPAHDIDRILMLKLSDEQKRLIFSENASRLFRIQI